MTARRPLFTKPRQALWSLAGGAAALAVMALSLKANTHPSISPLTRSGPISAVPSRIVSLDFCADQFLLELADRGQITALSTQSQAEHSFWRARAKGIPQVRARAEAVLALRPDLVVRTYGGDPGIEHLLASAGVQIGRAHV